MRTKKKNLKSAHILKSSRRGQKIKRDVANGPGLIFSLKNYYLAGVTILISVLVIFTVVKAGDLAPSASPAATSYTLGDIYIRLTANTAATEAGHDVSTSTAPAASFYTLKQIYQAIPTINAAKVLSGTTYLGVAGTYNTDNLTNSTVKSGVAYAVSSTGTLLPEGGTAQAAQVCTGQTFFGASQTDWDLHTGTLNPAEGTIKSGTTICGVAGTLVTNPAFGDSDGDYVLNTASNPGNYDATNLTANNVRNGITFGVGQSGTFALGYTYGSDQAEEVLTIADTPGTYNVSNLANNVIKQGITWGAALGSTGTLTPDGGTAAVADLFSGKTAHLTADWNLDTGTLNLACNTATFDAAGNMMADGYDGLGNGNNRWCMATSTNSAAAPQILSGYQAWANGLELTGTYDTSLLAAGTVKSGTAFGVGLTGAYPSAANALDGDTIASDATAADITKGVEAWTKAGVLMTGTYDPWTNQKYQTIDDWLNGVGVGSGSTADYIGEEATWSAVSGSPFDAGFATSSVSARLVYYPVGANVYLFSGRVMQDTRTGLWWSDVASTGNVTAVATSTTNDFNLTTPRVTGTGDGTRPWDTATTTATNGNAINFCNALNAVSFAGYTDWYLPTQKELMQAYIDGSANSLPNPGYNFWSSTESYSNTATAWLVSLSYGIPASSYKTNSLYVRCVRR